MELSVKERLVLLMILPTKGDITALKIIRTLMEDLGFDDAERQEINFRTEETTGEVGKPTGDFQHMWDEGSSVLKDVDIGERAKEIIVTAFEGSQNLHLDHLPVYERFVEDKNA